MTPAEELDVLRGRIELLIARIEAEALRGGALSMLRVVAALRGVLAPVEVTDGD